MAAEAAEVFVYMGEGGPVPSDVVRVRVHPSVTRIPANTFEYRRNLEAVELPEGLLEIGDAAFSCCDLVAISIPDTVEHIGQYALFPNDLTKLRIPPRVTQLSQGVVEASRSMFSLELPESIIEIGKWAVCTCSSLRNIAIPMGADETHINSEPGEAESTVFRYCRTLQTLFTSEKETIHALKHRFDNLPIHKMIYYQSYNTITSDQLNNSTDIRISRRRSKLNPSGKQQDCLGMTPLHVMACSTVQSLELYKLLVTKYPENLITKDKWGDVPLLYAVWGNAPDEIVQFLVESYQTIYPDFKLNWTDMVITLSKARVSVSSNVIRNLLGIQQESFPDQIIDWGTVLKNFTIVLEWPYNRDDVWAETFRFLLESSISKRMNAIGIKQWREDMFEYVRKKVRTPARMPNIEESDRLTASITAAESMLASYETEYHNLKEATSLIELASWKNKLDDYNNEGENRHNKRIKIEESVIREQSRINCGADIVIEHVLPYLFPAANID